MNRDTGIPLGYFRDTVTLGYRDTAPYIFRGRSILNRNADGILASIVGGRESSSARATDHPHSLGSDFRSVPLPLVLVSLPVERSEPSVPVEAAPAICDALNLNVAPPPVGVAGLTPFSKESIFSVVWSAGSAQRSQRPSDYFNSYFT
jgi:hypothetical protein